MKAPIYVLLVEMKLDSRFYDLYMLTTDHKANQC